MFRDIVFEQHYSRRIRRQMSGIYNDGAKHGVQIVLTVVQSLLNEGKEVTPQAIHDYMQEAANIVQNMGIENPTPKDVEQSIIDTPFKDEVQKPNVVQLFSKK